MELAILKLIKFVKTMSLNLVVIVGFVTVFTPVRHFNEGANLKEKLKSSLGHVTEYKLNIILFAFLGSLCSLPPRWVLPYVETLSVNELIAIVFVSVGTVTTVGSYLSPLNFKAWLHNKS